MSDKNFVTYEDASTVLTEYADEIKKGRFKEITYEEWLEMTEEERETGKYLVSDVPNANGKVKIDGMVKLWENPDPTSSSGFGPQTVVLSDNYTNYDLIYIDVLHLYSGTYYYPITIKPIVEYRTQITLADTNGGSSPLENLRRPLAFDTSENSITFSGGCREKDNDAGQTTDNTVMIPYRIYGIKLNHEIQINALARDVSTSADKCMLSTDVTKSVESALDELTTNLNKNGAKNYVAYPYYDGESKEASGITWTVNKDGTILANGTATETTFFRLALSNKMLNLKAGEQYILSGCPVNGSANGYRLDIRTETTGSTTSVIAMDLGEGATFTFPSLSDNQYAQVVIRIQSGTVINNLIFKPMIRLASDTNDTYEPYAKTNQELTKETTGLIDNINKNGSKNLFSIEDFLIKGGATYSVSGNTYTMSAHGNTHTVPYTLFDQDIDIIISGSIDGGTRYSNARLDLLDNNGNLLYAFYGTTTQNVRINKVRKIRINYTAYQSAGTTGCDFTNIMIRLASDPDDTYVPYAMTNQQLTSFATEPMFKFNTVRTESKDVATNTSVDFQGTITAIDGYTPFTIKHISATNSAMTIVEYKINGDSTKVIVYGRNATSAAVTGAYYDVTVIHIRKDLI